MHSVRLGEALVCANGSDDWAYINVPEHTWDHPMADMTGMVIRGLPDMMNLRFAANRSSLMVYFSTSNEIATHLAVL